MNSVHKVQINLQRLSRALHSKVQMDNNLMNFQGNLRKKKKQQQSLFDYCYHLRQAEKTDLLINHWEFLLIIGFVAFLKRRPIAKRWSLFEGGPCFKTTF